MLGCANKPECLAVRRWALPNRLTLYKEGVRSSSLDGLLDFPGLGHMDDNFDARQFRREFWERGTREDVPRRNVGYGNTIRN
jgi:hypothetical protein